jgi:hypothetical protein
MSQDSTDIHAFLLACANGDHEARLHFQEEYGEDIYHFPIKIYRLPEEEAGDFYLYVFENERIFTRVRTFEGRHSIQFRTFLSLLRAQASVFRVATNAENRRDYLSVCSS